MISEAILNLILTTKSVCNDSKLTIHIVSKEYSISVEDIVANHAERCEKLISDLEEISSKYRKIEEKLK